MKGLMGKLYGRSTAWLKSPQGHDNSSSPSPQGITEEPYSRSHAVGIDLGTTLSAAAYISETGQSAMVRNSDGEILTPSVVLFEHDKIVVGKKRAIGDGDQPRGHRRIRKTRDRKQNILASNSWQASTAGSHSGIYPQTIKGRHRHAIG